MFVSDLLDVVYLGSRCALQKFTLSLRREVLDAFSSESRNVPLPSRRGGLKYLWDDGVARVPMCHVLAGWQPCRMISGGSGRLGRGGED